MNSLKITFLGTGTSQGIPVIACDCLVCKSADKKDKRTRTSIMLSYNGANVVVDTGPDFRYQMLRENVNQLDAILFTHEHKDHVAGLDDIRAYNFVSNKAIPLYLTHQVLNALKREFQYVFDGSNYPGIPQVEINLIENSPFQLFGETIIPIDVLHYKLPVKGFRIKDFTYITDANFIDEKNIEKIKGSKVLVINALRKTKHISHFNLQEALDFISQINPQKAYLIHMSHLLGKHEDIDRSLPDNVFLSFDGLTLEL